MGKSLTELDQKVQERVQMKRYVDDLEILRENHLFGEQMVNMPQLEHHVASLAEVAGDLTEYRSEVERMQRMMGRKADLRTLDVKADKDYLDARLKRLRHEVRQTSPIAPMMTMTMMCDVDMTPFLTR
jgi:hypothetical protein